MHTQHYFLLLLSDICYPHVLQKHTPTHTHTHTNKSKQKHKLAGKWRRKWSLSIFLFTFIHILPLSPSDTLTCTRTQKYANILLDTLGKQKGNYKQINSLPHPLSLHILTHVSVHAEVHTDSRTDSQKGDMASGLCRSYTHHPRTHTRPTGLRKKALGHSGTAVLDDERSAPTHHLADYHHISTQWPTNSWARLPGYFKVFDVSPLLQSWHIIYLFQKERFWYVVAIILLRSSPVCTIFVIYLKKECQLFVDYKYCVSWYRRKFAAPGKNKGQKNNFMTCTYRRTIFIFYLFYLRLFIFAMKYDWKTRKVWVNYYNSDIMLTSRSVRMPSTSRVQPIKMF